MNAEVTFFILVFTRILSSVIFLPLMTHISSVPANLKAGFSFILAMIVVSAMPEAAIVVGDSSVEIGFLVIKEIVVGLILSFSLSMFFNIYYFIGQLWSMQGGLSQTMVADSNGGQMSAIGKLYTMAFTVIFFMSGGYHWFIKSLIETFQHIPVGEVVFKEELLWAAVDAVSTYWELGLKLASPIVGVIFALDCALGILARTVPQMNMFVIGIPLKVLVLFGFLFVTIPLLSMFNDVIIQEIINTFFNLARGMMP